MESSRPRGRPTALSLLGIRIGSHTGVYALGSFIGLLIGLINVIVLTRFLDPDEFGRLALLLFFAALLTIAYNLGSLQGTNRWVFGSAGEDEIDDDEEEAAPQQKRHALGVGLVTTILIAGLGTAVAIAVSPQVAGLLLQSSGDYRLVAIAAVSGGFGAIWRLVSNVPRLERKPITYIVLQAVRPLLVLGAVVSLVAGGGGIEGAITGVAIGSGAAVIIGLLAIRKSFQFGFSRAEAVKILGMGAFYIPIIASFWVIQNGDLFLLSRFVSYEDVGLYRFATRIAAVASYLIGALFMAWMPLRRSSAFAAAEDERGPSLVGTFITYFVALSMGLLLGLSIAADLLVQVAPPSYAGAASLIPVAACAFLSFGFMLAIYRSARFPRKRKTYVWTAMSCAVIFIGLAFALIPPLGPYGAALSVTGAFAVGAVALCVLSQRGPNPIQFERRRIAKILAVTAACGLAVWGGTFTGGWRPAIDVAIVLAYPVLLVLFGGIPREHVRALARIARSVLRRRSGAVELEPLRELDRADAAGLRALIVHRLTIDDLIPQLGPDPVAVAERLVAALRSLTGTSSGGRHDAFVGLYLFTETVVAERDQIVRELRKAGVDTDDLSRLELAIQELKLAPPEVWSRGAVTMAAWLDSLVRAAPAGAEGERALAALKAEREKLAPTPLTKANIGDRESRFGEVRYVLHDPGAESNSLVIAFSSSRPDTAPSHAHVGTLVRDDCPTLFVRLTEGRWMNWIDSGTGEIVEDLVTLINDVSAERGVPKENLICCGGSGGGARALCYGLKVGAGNILMGMAPVLLGDMMTKSWAARRLRRAVESLAAERGLDPEEGREWLNSIPREALRNPAGPAKIAVMTNEQDEIYPYCVPPLREACEESELLTLELTKREYSRHAEMRFEFRPFLSEKVSDILEEHREAAGTALPAKLVKKRRRKGILLDEEKSVGKSVRYVLHDPGVESESLLIAFSSSRPDTPPKHTHIGALSRDDCPTLFIRVEGYWLDRKGARDSRESLYELIDEVTAKLGVERRNVIACGGSNGGVRALGIGVGAGVGDVVVGSPTVLLGDAAVGLRLGQTTGGRIERMAKTVAASSDTEQVREWLNSLMLNVLENAEAETDIHVFTSENDETYPFCMPVLAEICERSQVLSLDLTLADYQQHRGLRDHFRPYLLETVERLLARNRARGGQPRLSPRPDRRLSPKPDPIESPRPAAWTSVDLAAEAGDLRGRESHYGDEVRYVLNDSGGREDGLVVGFYSGRAETGRADSQIDAMVRSECPTLFLRLAAGAWFDPYDGTPHPDVLAVIEGVCAERGLDPSEIVVCGEGVGGLRALNIGLRVGAGNVILGAPVVRLGDLLHGGVNLGPGSSARLQKVAEAMAGESGTKARDRLNSLSEKALRNPAAASTIHLFCSRDDELYRYSVPPLHAAAERSELLSLRLVIDDYGRHRDMRGAYVPFLERTLTRVLRRPAAGAQRTPESASR